jgi:hypothetical protein
VIDYLPVGGRSEFGWFHVWLICITVLCLAIKWMQLRKFRRVWEAESQSGMTYKQIKKILAAHNNVESKIPDHVISDQDRSIIKRMFFTKIHENAFILYILLLMISPVIMVGLMIWKMNT